MLRRLCISIWVAASVLALPAAAAAAEKIDKPTGPDHTLTVIFVIAAGLALFIAVMTMIDVARGTHTRRDDDH
jgi:hypothetical protein